MWKNPGETEEATQEDCAPANGIVGSLSKQRLGKGHAANDLTTFDPRTQTKSDLSHTDKTGSALVNISYGT